MEVIIKLKAINKKILTSYELVLKSLFMRKKITFSIFNLPSDRKRITVLKSPHVYKKAREQFEITHYKTIIIMKNVEKDVIVKQLVINKPRGINCSFTITS